MLALFALRFRHFNPRSREGSDDDRRRTNRRNLISIHAPARGATVWLVPPSPIIGISIHAPARGATNGKVQPSSDVMISIHAPARGATYSCSRLYSYHNISIHAPARGATGKCQSSTSTALFQSTLPRGERHRHRRR